MQSLTKKQKLILDFINSYIAENGISPTNDEIRKKFKLKAISTVHEHVNALKEKGYISKSDNLSRSIVLRRKILTVKTLLRRQDEIVNNFSREQKKLINEALNIEYKLAMVEQGYSLENIK